jgi:hypothetical protein
MADILGPLVFVVVFLFIAFNPWVDLTGEGWPDSDDTP